LQSFTVLALETSCDETAAAVVGGAPPGPGSILSNVVLSQLEEHAKFGGVVPEIAARAHVEAIDAIVEAALAEAGIAPQNLDAIAATAGPGLIGGVMVGLTTAKALALAWNKPLVAINHLEGHALTARMTHGTEFPYLLLLISGGHCQLLTVAPPGEYKLLGTTIDDAAGEAFDKVAKLLGLPYPGGPNIEKLAAQGNPKAFPLPRPMKGREGADFSFSGLKTAVRQIVQQTEFRPEHRADMAASFQAAVIDSMIDRVNAAMTLFEAKHPSESRQLVVAGGVAANRAIANALGELAESRSFRLTVPPPSLCTDNAAMIAWAGIEHCARNAFDPLDVAARARWPLAPRQPAEFAS